MLTVRDNLGATDNASIAITVNADPNGPPAAPTNLSANKTVSGKRRNKTIKVDLNWQDNTQNESDFVLERCQQLGKRKNRICTYGVLATLAQNAASYTETLSSGTYQYRLKAINTYGSSSYSNIVKVSSK